MLYAQEADYGKILLSPGATNPDSTLVLTAPGKGVFTLIPGNELVSIENRQDIPPIIFPEGYTIDDAVFGNSGLFVKSGSSIYLCKDRMIHFFSFDTDLFKLGTTDDDNLFILGQNNTGGILNYLDCHNREITYLASFPEVIVSAFGNKDEVYVITESSIYLLFEKKAHKVFSCFDRIIAASYTEGGLYFGTKNNLFLFVEKDTIGLILERGCKQLATDQGKLYVYFDDGSLICYKAIIVN